MGIPGIKSPFEYALEYSSVLRTIGFLLLFAIAWEIHLPKELQLLIVGIRFLLIPALLLFVFKDWPFSISLAIIYFSVVVLWSYSNEYKPLIIAMNLLASILYMRFALLMKPWKLQNLGYGLQDAVLVLSVITALVYFLEIDSFMGVDFHVHRQELNYSKWERYSLGNAIEFSFLLVSVYLISERLAGKRLLHSLLVLLVCIISGSRLLILISLAVSLRVFLRFTLKTKLFAGVTLFLMVLLSLQSLSAPFDLVFDRFNSWSQGSAEERSLLLFLVVNASAVFDTLLLLFGDGYGSSFAFFSERYTTHSTESVLLQIFMETGLVGLLLILSLFFKYFREINLNLSGIIKCLILIQLFFFLPIFSYMSIVFFLIGLNMNRFVHD